LIASNNSDIAVMEPASRIREILEIARKTPIKEYNYWSNYTDATLPRVAGP
jgi:signal recognition particle receptor subunit beta